MELHYKGKGRIYVRNGYDVSHAKRLLKDIDPDEYDNYCPDEYIAAYPGRDDLIRLEYTGKFNPNLEKFFAKCKGDQIMVVVLTRPDTTDENCNPYPPTIYKNFPDRNLFGEEITESKD